MSEEHSTKRRLVIKQLGLAIGATTLIPTTIASQGNTKIKKNKRILRVAHVTDIHMSDDNDAPSRFRKCMKDIKKHDVDFFLNGGDTIMAADYADITRERVKEQWKLWESLQDEFAGYEMYSCLGNHDMWWAAPDKDDAMYGKNYVVGKMKMSNRYYSFKKKNWYFIVLDSNNKNAGSLDDEQRMWLEKELLKIPQEAFVLVMSHYPILGVSTIPYGGSHTDSKYITKLFNKHRDKKIHCISGHMHLLDSAIYNEVNYYCNGSLSGFWWGEGDKDSAGKYWYHETPPGYTIIDFFEDGTISNTYYPHQY